MINGNGWYYFTPISNSTIAATTTSANVAIGTEGAVLEITNEGPSTVFIALGTDNTVTATTGGTSTAAGGSYNVAPGAIKNILIAPAITYVAAIAVSGSSIVRLSRGRGV